MREPNVVAAVLTATTTPPMFLCTLHAQQVLDLSPVAAGLLFPPFNAALLAIAPGASALPSLLGGFVLLGAGLGVASVASTARGTAALTGADQGLASGLLSTSAQVGTVLGLAVIVPIAAARTAALHGGDGGEVAGYELGFVLSAAVAAAAALAVGARARRAGAHPRDERECCGRALSRASSS